MSRVLPLWSSALLLIASQALATPVINVGDHWLQPNQANQAVTISVTGGDLVKGVNLFLQIDGGTTGPAMQSLDVLAGTIFATNNAGQSWEPAGPNVIFGSTYVPNDGSVVANGLLATVYLDTTGWTSGTWSFSAAFDYEGSPVTSDFAGTPATIINGSVGIVPEPGSLALLFAAAAGVLVWQRARRKS